MRVSINLLKQQGSISVEVYKELLKVMNNRAIAIPKYGKNQQVSFVGGTGTIRNYLPDSGTWTYTIEMDLKPESDTGRVGCETTILLDEADIELVR